MQAHDIEAALNAGGVTNEAAKTFVKQWAAHLNPAHVEVVSAADDKRLVSEALTAGEIQEVAGGRYFSRSYSKDTARSEERTFVATSNPADKGSYNNWADSSRDEAQGRRPDEGRIGRQDDVRRALPHGAARQRARSSGPPASS